MGSTGTHKTIPLIGIPTPFWLRFHIPMKYLWMVFVSTMPQTHTIQWFSRTCYEEKISESRFPIHSFMASSYFYFSPSCRLIVRNSCLKWRKRNRLSFLVLCDQMILEHFSTQSEIIPLVIFIKNLSLVERLVKQLDIFATVVAYSWLAGWETWS